MTGNAVMRAAPPPPNMAIVRKAALAAKALFRNFLAVIKVPIFVFLISGPAMSAAIRNNLRLAPIARKGPSEYFNAWSIRHVFEAGVAH